MIDTRRWISHFVLGLAGIGVAAYVVDVVLGIAGRPGYHDEVLLFSAVALVICIASLFNFFAAYAYRFGVLDEVRGTRAAAILVRDGIEVRRNVKIWIANNADAGNEKLNAGQQAVLMIAGGVPYVCSARAYHIN